MIEVLIVSILISVWLFAIFAAANHAKLVNQRIIQSIIANQLATEWAEIIYQTRNTNLLKYEYDESKNIDICRLALNYDNCNTTRYWSNLETDNFLLSWYYYISSTWINKCNEENCEDNFNKIYAICLTWWVRTPCPEWHDLWWDESKYWKFFRKIEWLWVYNMDNNKTWWQKISGTPASLTNYPAQEYRFCSRVYRIGGQDWEVEICWTMTNFIK